MLIFCQFCLRTCLRTYAQAGNVSSYRIEHPAYISTQSHREGTIYVSKYSCLSANTRGKNMCWVAFRARDFVLDVSSTKSRAEHYLLDNSSTESGLSLPAGASALPIEESAEADSLSSPDGETSSGFSAALSCARACLRSRFFSFSTANSSTFRIFFPR